MDRIFQYAICILLHLLTLTSLAKANFCRCHPEDPCWPSISAWSRFNNSISGRLIATTPIASVCHTTFEIYDSRACADLRSRWYDPATHFESASSPMASWSTNFSCSPFTEPNASCTVGPLARYAVNVSSAVDVQKSLEFVRKYNIRLVIRNTGHDYLGKSTGAGSLALWMHYYRFTEYVDEYKSTGYTGPAMRIGAGVQGGAAIKAASAHGYTLVTGNCPSVGMAGGYTQGGGHGQLASRFGLATDQVLEWEIVTAAGQILTVSQTKHGDLFWALSGGGGGTFALVLTVTVRLHPELETASAMLEFTGSGTDIAGPFWRIVAGFLVDMLPLLDSGGVVIWYIKHAGVGTDPVSDLLTFSLAPAVLPGGEKEQLQKYIASTLQSLQTHNITYHYKINTFPSFHDSYSYTTPSVNISDIFFGGRFIPRSTIESGLEGFLSALRSTLQHGATVSGLSLNVSRAETEPPFENSVNPAWRETTIAISVGLPVDDLQRQINVDRQRLMTQVLVPGFAGVAGFGKTNRESAYLNEADVNEPDWQSVFYGENYDRLKIMKEKYDQNGIFYGRTGVGSEQWEERADGRLCRVRQ